MKPYFETKLGKLYHGDCLEIMPELEQVDLIVTSPPYGKLRDYKGYVFNFNNIADNLQTIIKHGGIVVWIVADSVTHGSETGTSFKQALYFMSIGLNLHDTMIYHKRSQPMPSNRYEQHFEYMFVLTKDKPKTFNPIKIPCVNCGQINSNRVSRKKNALFRKRVYCKTKRSKTKGNVWFYETGGMKGTKDKIAYNHPATFPELLAHDHILSWSNKYDMVLDPMVGSGTVPKMCERLNRKWLACEISEEYCEIAAKRVEAEASQLKLFA